MRILFLSEGYPPETGAGGIGSYVATVAAALARRGHEVHVLTCTPGQASMDRRDGDVYVHRRGTLALGGLERLLRSGKARSRLETSISCFLESRRLGIDFDVVESPDYLAEGLVFSLLRVKPHVGHLHTPLLVLARHNGLAPTWDRRLGDKLERMSMRRADVVTSPSTMLAEELFSSGWLRGRFPRVVRLPVELERWSGLTPAEATRACVLSVGRLEPLKAPETLVEAAALLATTVPDVEAVFVGGSNRRRDGKPYADWTAQLARARQAPCRFVGRVAESEMREWYGKARVVVLTSRHDNFPVSGLEAMAAGRPLVVTSATGVAELLGNGGGAVVPPRDARALAQALHPYLIDAGLAGRAGEVARETVARECDPDAIAQQREAVYMEATDSWRRRRIRRPWQRGASPRPRR